MSSAQIKTAGFDGFLVTFGAALSEPANRAALAFRAAVEAEGWEGVEETSTSLVSAYLRFDPFTVEHTVVEERLKSLLGTRDWLAASLPANRRLWRVPTAFTEEAAPQLEEAAHAAGMSVNEAVVSISQTQARVNTIGFAPGMPYLGELSEAWDIPRQTKITDNVPAGALCVAIRQLVLFPRSTPTGWRHIGQTRFSLFQPETERPFVLKPGDEILFDPVSIAELARHENDPLGGAEWETIA